MAKQPAARPASTSGYSGTPLPKKLGMKAGTTLGLDGAPEGFEAVLGKLPEGARVVRAERAARQLTLWFVRTKAELARGIGKRVPRAAASGLWIVWPKRTSPLAQDLREDDVRNAGLAAGLVDFKVCAVDPDWSGLRFAQRKTEPKQATGKSGR
jgi:hypothetical protein